MSGELDRGWDFEDTGLPGPEGDPEEIGAVNTELPEALAEDREGVPWNEAEGSWARRPAPFQTRLRRIRSSQGRQHLPSRMGTNGLEFPRGDLRVWKRGDLRVSSCLGGGWDGTDCARGEVW
jgi:hypothetical protein